MRINFSKLTAAGNDFVLIDNREALIDKDLYQKLGKELCNRRYGIGGDGLIFIEKSENPNVDFKMKYLNSDGSFAEMCGNGGRSIAKFAYSIGAAKEEMIFETDAGIVKAEILAGSEVRLNMFDPKDLKRGIRIKLDDKDFDIDFINTGVPHAVTFVGGIENFDVFKYGRLIRNAEAFRPSGANADFVCLSKEQDNTIIVRTYERGVEDETLACGTGIIASAIISALKNFVKVPVKIIARGGDKLSVSFKQNGGKIHSVVLEGPAKIAFAGIVEI